jgi:hypothetical protein
MKIAVLIVGELRTFPYCRKTMSFLKQPPGTGVDVDVYFHTWEITKMHNPPIGRHLNPRPLRLARQVTEEEIHSLLGRPATVKVHPVLDDKDGFLIMRKGWLMGLEMIEESGIEYDFVYVMRPDLFYRGPVAWFMPSGYERYQNAVGFLPIHPPDAKLIADCDFFSTYDNIKKLLCEDVLELDQKNGSIHTIWYDYVMSKGLECTTLPFFHTEPHIIARFPMTADSTWKEVETLYWKLFHERPI